VARYLSFPAWTEAGQAAKRKDAMIKGYETGEHLNLIVERSADAVPIGTAGLFHIHEHLPPRRDRLHAGPRFLGAGLMHDALVTLVRHAFGAMDLNRLEADIDPRNLASAKSLERLGFRHEGLMRERWIVNGEVSDTGFYGLLRREWKN
jgi:RimJ/RimL family protein N-acetyltransferase